MSAAQLPWLPLVAKLMVTAAIVVTASVIVERTGALTGALATALAVPLIWNLKVWVVRRVANVRSMAR